MKHEIAQKSCFKLPRMISRQVLGCAVAIAWVWERVRPSPPILALEEVQALREEVARTRDAIVALEEASGSCNWQLWIQGHLLRLTGVADIVLILVLLWVWFSGTPRRGSAAVGALCDKSSEGPPWSSSASGRLTEPSAAGSETSTASPSKTARARPTRPSDLRKWQT